MASANRESLIWGWAAIVLALLVYLTGLGSDHLATNGDELVYAQITKLTAASGHYLPLQSLHEKDRNTKPPLLFWQGILSTDWGRAWTLARLRLPDVLYTLLAAGMVILVCARRLKSLETGIFGAALYLCFFSTYRYGRVFLTSGPETFWLFLPLVLLLLLDEPKLPRNILWVIFLGIAVGIGMLYKSFALGIPVVATIGLWDLRARGWRRGEFLLKDTWKFLVLVAVSLAVFGLWFWLDPNPSRVFSDFVLKENVGKFDTEHESYLLNLLWGESSFWRIAVSYPLNAGLLAPAVLGLVVDAWRRRKNLASIEVLLWIWIVVVAAFFCLPNQRDERYLIPAMPALALLLALRMKAMPRWISLCSIAAAAGIILGLAGLGGLLQRAAADGILYPWWALLVPILGLAVCIAGLVKTRLSLPLLAPSILFVYLSYAAFLIPLDHGRGVFTTEAIEAVRDKEVMVPSNFNAREESYGFLLPGSKVKAYKAHKKPPQAPLVIISLPLDEPPPSGTLLGKRLNMIDRFNQKETTDILLGNVTHHLFRWDWLVKEP